MVMQDEIFNIVNSNKKMTAMKRIFRWRIRFDFKNILHKLTDGNALDYKSIVRTHGNAR
jgi:hypothetical protein